MPRGVYERKPKEDQMSTETVAEKQPSKMFPVILTKNYCPRGEYEIVGYLKPEKREKDAAGNMRLLEKEEFIKGEMNPPHTPGIGFKNKIWAGTHIKVPVEEAKYLVSKKLAERADDIAA